MIKRSWFTVALAFACVGFVRADGAYVEGQVLVKFRPASAGLARVYHDSIGAKVVRSIPEIGVENVQLPRGVTTKQALRYYSSLAAVEYAEPNGISYAISTPNDPMFAQQYSPQKMKAPFAWDLTTGLNTVVIAIVDTGVDYNHQDLSGKVIKGGDFIGNDSDPMDEHDHGTHCAGIAAAKTNNGVGIAGVGYNATILAERVLDANGSGSWDAIAAGIVDASNRKADVISMSIGGGGSKATEDACNLAWSRGAVLLGAAGNSNVSTKSYPGAYDKVICVGATDANDAKANFSNFGADWVDVAAPGVNVLSTVRNNNYAEFSGTSMACPNAAGVVSLMISYAGKGTMTNQELRDTLESHCVNVGTWVAKGRVDAFAAVSSTVKPIVDTRGPIAAAMFDGTSVTGKAQDLWVNDKARYTVFSRPVANLGGVAGAELKYTYGYAASQFMAGTLTVRSAAKTGATLSIYMKRNNGVYDLLKSAPIADGEATNTLTLPANITPYLTGKTLTFVVRTVLPTRYGGNVYGNAMNVATLETKSSPKVTP